MPNKFPLPSVREAIANSLIHQDLYITGAAPVVEIFENRIEVTNPGTPLVDVLRLFAGMEFSNIPMEDKLWSCYLHACLMYIQGEALTNKSFRDRFGIPETSSSSSSRLIREAIGKNLIKVLDPNTAPRYMKYIPIWA